ncbi:transposase [Streptomyces sp. NPDC054802]
MFGIVCDDRLCLGYCEYMVEGAARGENAAKLGWTRRESLPPGHLRPGDDGERTGTRTPWRNGHREKTVTTQAGDLELAIPKLRAGTSSEPVFTSNPRISQPPSPTDPGGEPPVEREGISARRLLVGLGWSSRDGASQRSGWDRSRNSHAQVVT